MIAWGEGGREGGEGRPVHDAALGRGRGGSGYVSVDFRIREVEHDCRSMQTGRELIIYLYDVSILLRVDNTEVSMTRPIMLPLTSKGMSLWARETRARH